MNLFTHFNRLLAALLTGLFVSLSAAFPALSPLFASLTGHPSPITIKISLPSARLENLPASASAALDLSGVSVQSKPSVVTSAPVPWGTTEKIGPHQYRTFVGNDPAMGTPDETLFALNSYRRDHGAGPLSKDDGLCRLAQMRAGQQEKLGTLDGHQGLKDYMDDPKHWEELNVKAIGENASYGYVLSGVHLIEWVFDSDTEHRANQLNPQWNLACAGISGVTVDIIFGQR